ncbi:energy-coupling factor transporter transmembrane protein EcfT [Clostridium sp. SHJSY1]|uniref:energy-coupling factor transporter transmembrane component T family protein n=1 Tax=Clostridium sp. SHJSY1 TaxID=2942483 RepID=UPI002875055C|nr:energy-coupling factor transporter transmembrane component T [Clostridium sp. SHJSY1]MDS0524846.1 energy-coupling factor transporter transmembrane protein EcfT [Clostridium sp. SHJSY1]
MIPDWLLEKDSYNPKEEKNSYLEKSIFSIIKTISMIRESKDKDKLIYRINPILKVINTILIIVFISLSRSFYFLSIVDIYVLMGLFCMEKKSRKRIFVSSLIFPFFTLIILVPAIIYGNVFNSLLIFQKILTSIVLINLLSHSTKWSDISKSLKFMFIPDMFIWIIDITIKYIVLLGEYSINLLYALKLRSIGKTTNKYNTITNIMGNLFIKSYKMSEEMYYAMECRGFAGEYNKKINFKLKKSDYTYLIINLSMIILFAYLN